MTRYNGHYDWIHWNVSLWINNDEALYRLALACLKGSANRTEAATRFVANVNAIRTPDGALYTIRNVRAAMRGISK